MEIRFFQESNEAYGNVEDVVKDLNLTFIARNMAHDNYGDVTYILEFLKHPLVTEEEIAQRQKVVMAACDNTPFIYELRKVIVQTWEELQQSLKAVQDTRGKHLMEQTVIGIQVESIRNLVTGLKKIHQVLQKHENQCRTDRKSVV